MADKKIIQLAEVTTVNGDTLIPVEVNPGGVSETKKITVNNLIDKRPIGYASADKVTDNSIIPVIINPIGVPENKIISVEDLIGEGWIPASEPWGYASTTSFVITGDYTTKYQKGTKIKLVQSGVTKYFYVISSSYADPITTVNITGGSDYTLNNVLVTDNYYSRVESPVDFPNWFNWTPTYTGFSTTPTQPCRFCIIGRTCCIEIGPPSVTGTSNATDFTITAPVLSSLTCPGSYFPIRYSNNGVVGSTSGMGRLPGGSNIVQLFTNWGGTSWIASGTKYSVFSLSYEI